MVVCERVLRLVKHCCGRVAIGSAHSDDLMLPCDQVGVMILGRSRENLIVADDLHASCESTLYHSMGRDKPCLALHESQGLLSLLVFAELLHVLLGNLRLLMV